MSERGGVEFLKDIQEAMKRIEYYTEDRGYNEFLKDLKNQDTAAE